MKAAKRAPPDTYEGLLSDVAHVIEEARLVAARSVNAVMTATYWLVGRRIVEQEQQGAKRAGYGERLLKRLACDLSGRFGRGFSERNLEQMRAFCLGWPIPQTATTVLCVERDQAVARYALEGLPNKVLAAEYRMTLPQESLL